MSSMAFGWIVVMAIVKALVTSPLVLSLGILGVIGYATYRLTKKE